MIPTPFSTPTAGEVGDQWRSADNRGRRNNLRVRGVPEEIEAERIPSALATIFNTLLGRPEEATVHLVRAHRALCPRPQNDSSPRDIVCCLVDFGLKELILQKARGQDEIVFNSNKIELYQDLSPVTLQQRRALRPLLTVLRDKNIPYRWRFPFGLSATRSGRTALLREPDELEDFCKSLDIPVVELPEWLQDFWIPDTTRHLVPPTRGKDPISPATSPASSRGPLFSPTRLSRRRDGSYSQDSR